MGENKMMMSSSSLSKYVVLWMESKYSVKAVLCA